MLQLPAAGRLTCPYCVRVNLRCRRIQLGAPIVIQFANYALLAFLILVAGVIVTQAMGML